MMMTVPPCGGSDVVSTLACQPPPPSMRVIAGTYGGRRLQAPPGEATRPTSDRVREALFSILGERVAGARVLDLFAGSGALGLEALSRGAASVTFVDSAPAAIRAVEANLAALGAAAEVVRADAPRWLGAASAGGRQYDLLFLDPPYRRAGELGAPLSAALGPVLAEGAVVVAEADRRAPLELSFPLTDERRYGDTLIRIHAP
jgi:16S rRNA (guanine(966)-N(2))-methyltransferase RsmD